MIFKYFLFHIIIYWTLIKASYSSLQIIMTLPAFPIDTPYSCIKIVQYIDTHCIIIKWMHIPNRPHVYIEGPSSFPFYMYIKNIYITKTTNVHEWKAHKTCFFFYKAQTYTNTSIIIVQILQKYRVQHVYVYNTNFVKIYLLLNKRIVCAFKSVSQC